MAIQVELIKSIPYFSGLSPAELDSLKGLIFETTAERGRFILLESEPADALYFVVSGVVKVFKTSADGREQILQIVRPGESFNDAPVFDGGPNPASAQAMGPVVLYRIKNSDMGVILRTHPQVALNVIHVLSQKLRHLVSLVEDLSFKHVTARLAKILLEYAGDGVGSAKPRLTQQEMAAMAGTAREMIGRSLKELEDEKIIRLEHHRIVVTDKEALKKWAGVVE
ncbi:MAG: Crp/Fnr family transcriptional regulator [Chloroflexi bacterium]|jgi:CRP-like cAMP-binding protein|nr:Crp/Fnr family transcriptional regulator [Chloroflexota bacterium]